MGFNVLATKVFHRSFLGLGLGADGDDDKDEREKKYFHVSP